MSRDEKALGVRIDEETYGRVHDAVIALSGPPQRMTKKKLVTAALRAYVALLSRKHNEGQPFKVQKNRRLVPGASDGPVGKRKNPRVASKPRAGKTSGGNSASAAPARRRRRRSK